MRIHAAGVNPYDTYMRGGTHALKPKLPYTPGSDGAGVVEAVGEGVKKVKRDDRVYTARTVTGAYAESLSKSRCITFLRTLISSKAQGCGCPTGPHIMRYISQRKRTPLKQYWSTVQVAVWALRQSKSRALWVRRCCIPEAESASRGE